MVFFIRGNRGQSVIEFAFILPLLLLVVFGITEFSRAWMTVNILTQAAREGARLAVVTGPNEEMVINRVTEVCRAAGVEPEGITITPPSPADPERKVTVTVKTEFQVIPGTILGTFNGKIPLSATSVMRHES
jgi:Flp pilus assembly protein TadG